MSNLKNKAEDYFEQSSISYTQDYYLSKGKHPKWLRQFVIADWIRNFLNPSSIKILDLGCGPGLLQEELARSGYKGVGLDSSPSMISLCKERAEKHAYSNLWSFQLGDCENTPFATGSFDCVVCSGLIEYMPNDENLLQEAARLLKPNGYLIINVTNALGFQTALNTPFHYLKSNDIIFGIAKLVKRYIPGDSAEAKRLGFLPRKHSISKFKRTVSDLGFVLKDGVYQGFSILPAPFDRIYLSLFPDLNYSLERLNITPVKYFGASYLMCLQMGSSS